MPEGHAEVLLLWVSARRAKRVLRLPLDLTFPNQREAWSEASHLVVGMHTRGTRVCIPEAKGKLGQSRERRERRRVRNRKKERLGLIARGYQPERDGAGESRRLFR